MLRDRIFCSRMWWLTLSKALDRSRRTSKVISPSSIALYAISVKFNSASSVDVFLL
jgi:hypothetical protein